jgi:hypothetical protein
MRTQLLTPALKARLIANWEKNIPSNGEIDHMPVIKCFTPDAQATWLFTELDPSDGDTLFGLCDMGLGLPELSYCSLEELETVTGPFGLHVERDLHWEADKTLLEYAAIARQEGRIVS